MTKLNLSKEFSMGVLINIVIAITSIIMFSVFTIALFVEPISHLGHNIWYICLFVLGIIYMIKFVSLPLYFFIVNKYSQNLFIVNFLSNIKTNIQLQNKILIYCFIVDILICIIGVLFIRPFYSFGEFLSNLLFWFVIYLTTGAGLLGSYLSLFVWWKIQNKTINCEKP